ASDTVGARGVSKTLGRVVSLSGSTTDGGASSSGVTSVGSPVRPSLAGVVRCNSLSRRSSSLRRRARSFDARDLRNATIDNTKLVSTRISNTPGPQRSSHGRARCLNSVESLTGSGSGDGNEARRRSFRSPALRLIGIQRLYGTGRDRLKRQA